MIAQKGVLNERLTDFLLYSNLYLACGAAIVAYATALTFGLALTWEVLFIPFASGFFIYTLNRYTDKDEDRINVPVRVQFFDRCGKWFLATSAIVYCAALAIAFTKGALILALSVFPLCVGLLYSFLGLKKVVIGKNLSVGVAWGSTVLLTGAFYNNLSLPVLLLFAFFAIEFFVNTVIFDVKDIQGDRAHRIITLPVALGIRRTQRICYALNGIALALLLLGIAVQWLPLNALVLCALAAYILAYIYLCNETRGRLYFGLLVDGEFMFLLLAYLGLALLPNWIR